MLSFQKQPISNLSTLIKSFWMIDSENDSAISQEKIIPDGYPEMIFHYKKPYKININGNWSIQTKYLIAGQIRNYFLLESMGSVGIFAIKFQPYALRTLFGIDMSALTDRVISIDSEIMSVIEPIKKIATGTDHFEEKVMLIEKWFQQHLMPIRDSVTSGQEAVQLIIAKKGVIHIEEILRQVNLSERALERYFQKYVGLSPKFYSRIIRFANIFELTNKSKIDWSDIAYKAGFYDQSHFIKNFKEFSGEEPCKYKFIEENLANFFLRK